MSTYTIPGLKRCALVLSLVFFSNSLISQPCLYKYINTWGDINQVLETPDSTVWVATTIGVHRFDNLDDPSQYLPVVVNNPVNVVKMAYHSNTLWLVARSQGLFSYDGSTWTHHTPNPVGNATIYFDLTITDNGDVWFATDDGVSVLTGGSITTYRPFTNNIIWAIGSNGNTVYAASRSNTGVMKYYDGTTWKAIPDNTANLDMRRVQRIDFDDNNRLYTLGLGGSFWQFDGNLWKDIVPGSPIDDFVLVGNDAYFLSQSQDYEFIRLRAGNLDTLQREVCLSGQAAFLNKGLEPGSFWVGGENAFTTYISKLFVSQPEAYNRLAVNNLQAGFYKGGNLFSNPEGEQEADFKPNIPGSPSLIYTSSLWATGTAASGARVSAETYALWKEMASGPAADVYDSQYLKKYDRTWKVTRSQIEDFKLNFNSPGYVIPESIENWPGNGDVSRGEAFTLAPFYDVNENSIYEPDQGDYPAIKGDEAVFFMYNDLRGLFLQTESAPLGIEVHGMAYAYDTNDVALSNAIFVSYRVFNRSGEALTGFKVGVWSDFDLGNPTDDLLGCDDQMNLIYSYNASADDAGPIGFGMNPPASGILFLSDSLGGAINYARSGSANIPAVFDPTNGMDYMGYLNQLWRDDQPLRLELPSGLGNAANGDGYDPSAAGPITSFHYNDRDQWYQSPLLQYDSRSLGVGTEQSLQDGEDYCLEIAFLQARDQTPGAIPFSSVIKLKSQAETIRMYYAQDSSACLANIVSVAEDEVKPQAFIYPNPASTRLFIEPGLLDIEAAVLYNINGVPLQKLEEGASVLDIHELPVGIYMVKVQFEDGSISVRKIVKE